MNPEDRPVGSVSPARKRSAADDAGTPGSKSRAPLHPKNRFSAYGSANCVTLEPFIAAANVPLLVDYLKTVSECDDNDIFEKLFVLANENAGGKNMVTEDEWRAWMVNRFAAKDYLTTSIPTVINELKVVLFGGLVSIQSRTETCVKWIRPDGEVAASGDLIGCPAEPTWVVDLFLTCLGMDDYRDFWSRLHSVEDEQLKELWKDILRTSQGMTDHIESLEEDGPWLELGPGMYGKRKCVEVRLEHPFIPQLYTLQQQHKQNPVPVTICQPQFNFAMQGLPGMHQFMGLLAAKAVSPPAFGSAGRDGDFPVRTFVRPPERFAPQPPPLKLPEKLEVPRVPKHAQVNWSSIRADSKASLTPEVMRDTRMQQALHMHSTLKDGKQVDNMRHHVPNPFARRNFDGLTEAQEHGMCLYKAIQGRFA